MFTADQEADYQAGLVRFHQNNSNKAVGAGCYLRHGYVLTCAHVITHCLGLGTKPQTVAINDVINQLIQLDFPFVAYSQLQQAVILPELWRLDGEDLAVLAVLQVEAIPEGVRALEFRALESRASQSYREHPYYVFGFPDGHPRGVESRGKIQGAQTAGWIQIEDLKTQGIAIEPGFSGAPVWDETLGAIAGITVARDKDRESAKVGFMIPYEKLKPALDAIALFPLLATVDDQHWKNAYRLVKPDYTLNFQTTDSDPKTILEAILKVRDLPAQGRPYGAIEQFIGYLASPRLGLDIQPSLIQWLLTRHIDVDVLLSFVREREAEQTENQAAGLASHLLFWVQAALNSDRYFV
jgi:hypothetical protein